jgi:serine phosphatase RsbU (regulator of sigma subunit)
MSQRQDLPIRPAKQPAENTVQLQNAKLAALHELALDLTSTFDLNDVLQRVAELTQALSASAHAHVFLYDSDRNELHHAASHWSSEQRAVSLQPRRTGITYAVASTGQPEFIEDTANHPAYAQVPPDLRPGALACLPLAKGEHILGTLNLGYWEPHRFDAETRSFLDLMARNAAIAIENARLYQLAIEKARMEHELQVAREVQASLIPRETPRIAGWDFATLWQPAHIVSGDFYDFVSIGQSPLQGILIGDVTDKGMPAALFMVLARSTIRASITTACCPADFITHANRLLCADAADGMFVTLCYAQLDPLTGELVYVNAGHNPPLLLHRDTEQFVQLTRTGMALGVDETCQFDQRTVQLDPGDLIVLYTDGVTDATNAAEQEFGLERLRQAIIENRHLSAPEMSSALNDALREFVDAASQFDDIAVVVMKRI